MKFISPWVMKFRLWELIMDLFEDLFGESEIELSPDDKRHEEWRSVSKAVVACDGCGNGAILFYFGSGFESDIECGIADLGDFGLDDAPLGISIWEGKHIWCPGGYECPDDGDFSLDGKFRNPTEKEWLEIKLNKSPWDGK